MSSKEFGIKILPLKDKMYRLAKSILSGRADAEDVVQDVLERMWRVRHSVAGMEKCEAFVMSSVRNACLDRLRSNKAAGKRDDVLREFSPRWIDGNSRIEMADLRHLTETAIACLPAKQQIVMHLRDVEGYEFEEIASICKMDAAAVRVALSRARKSVREKLQKAMSHGERY